MGAVSAEPPEIGTEAWWAAARRLGVRRPEEAREIRGRSGRAEAQRAQRAAEALVGFMAAPAYGRLLGSLGWQQAKRPLRVWLVRQFAAILGAGSEAQRAAVLYMLGVDFFAVPGRAGFVFPRLERMLVGAAWAPVLAISTWVPWSVKRAAYRRAAQQPGLHAVLAEVLRSSVAEGEADVVEASAIGREIGVTLGVV